MVITSHGTSLTKTWTKPDEYKTNVLSKQKAQKKLVPEGWQHKALTPCTNCTAEEWSCANRQKKRHTTGFYVTVGDRCINMLCWVSKGISLFFFLWFYFIFFSFLKDISRSRYWDCWNVLGIHSTLQTSRLESGSNDYCLAHPGFFCCFSFTTLLPHWQERHTQQNRNTTTKHSENSTCPTIFFNVPPLIIQITAILIIAGI